MQPAFSVIFLTTLIGTAQGLFLALWGIELSTPGVLVDSALRRLFVNGSALALLLSVFGLIASFFHLGRPERAWRAAAQWRTSWLSREVIVLPLFMAGVFVYGVLHLLGLGGTRAMGLLTALAAVALFISTGMVYASIRFLREWASPLTLVNYTLLGCASGLVLATLVAAASGAVAWVPRLGWLAMGCTVLAAVSRTAALVRNARLAPVSTLQSATGIKHPRIVQKSQGFMGGSFNTREFFHGRTPAQLRAVRWAFLVLCFPVPIALLALGLGAGSHYALALAFVLQYLGLLAERWDFFVHARHPQNLYYQSVA